MLQKLLVFSSIRSQNLCVFWSVSQLPWKLYCEDQVADLRNPQFLVLFGLSTGKRKRLRCSVSDLALAIAMHTWQCVKYRSWWFLPTVVTGMLELFGWSARLWLSKSPLALTPYKIQ